jgi:hypothetical protein
MSRRADRISKLVKDGALLPVVVALNGDAWYTMLAAINIAELQVR